MWHEDYKKIVIAAGLGKLIVELPEHARYVFGNDGILFNYIKAVMPGVVAGRGVLMRYSVVKSDTLALLLGKDLLRESDVVYRIGKATSAVALVMLRRPMPLECGSTTTGMAGIGPDTD